MNLIKKIRNCGKIGLATGLAASSLLLSPLEARCQDNNSNQDDALFMGALGWLIGGVSASKGNAAGVVVGQGMSSYANAIAGKSTTTVNVNAPASQQQIISAEDRDELRKKSYETRDEYLERMANYALEKKRCFAFSCNRVFNDSYPSGYLGLKLEYPAKFKETERIVVGMMWRENKGNFKLQLIDSKGDLIKYINDTPPSRKGGRCMIVNPNSLKHGDYFITFEADGMFYGNYHIIIEPNGALVSTNKTENTASTR